MIVGYDAKRAFKNKTGLGNYSRMLVCGLASEFQDYHAFLYSPQMSGYYKSFFSGYANISTRQPSGVDRWFPRLWRGFGVTLHLAGDKVQLYHGLSHELPHRIPSKIKKIVTIHDLVAWRFPQYIGPFDAWIHRMKMRHSCCVADVVVAISEQTKRDLIDLMHVPENKIRVLYQSCDPMFWQPVEQDEIAAAREKYSLPEKYIIAVGTIEERKNQLALVEAMKQMPDDMYLLLVGRRRGKYGDQVVEEATKSAFSSHVRVLENADFEDFPALYAGSLASAYVSKFEGFGIPILEAMCAGTPVLTSNCSSMPEVGGDAVLYANPESVDEIASQLKRLVSDDALRADLLKKAEVQRQKFSEKAVATAFYNLYSELLSEDGE